MSVYITYKNTYFDQIKNICPCEVMWYYTRAGPFEPRTLIRICKSIFFIR